MAAGFERVAAQLRVLITRPRLAGTAAGWAAANWLLDATVLWLFIAAFGHRTSVPGLLVAYGLANVLAAIPLSPGGLGVIETTLIVTLVGFDTPRAAASLGWPPTAWSSSGCRSPPVRRPGRAWPAAGAGTRWRR